MNFLRKSPFYKVTNTLKVNKERNRIILMFRVLNDDITDYTETFLHCHTIII